MIAAGYANADRRRRDDPPPSVLVVNAVGIYIVAFVILSPMLG